MERRLVVSMACGGKSRLYSEFTFPLIQKYAQKCGADFYAIFQEDKDRFNYIGYQKWRYKDLLEVYDRILHIDADMVVRSTTPNLFDIIRDDEFAAVDEQEFASPNIESPYKDRYKDLIHLSNRLGTVIDPKYYINVGMYLFSKDHRFLFDELFSGYDIYFREQTELNYKLQYHNYKTVLLGPKYNFMSLMENHGLKKEDAYIIHYAGNWRGNTDDEVLEMMKFDYV